MYKRLDKCFCDEYLIDGRNDHFYGILKGLAHFDQR